MVRQLEEDVPMAKYISVNDLNSYLRNKQQIKKLEKQVADLKNANEAIAEKVEERFNKGWKTPKGFIISLTRKTQLGCHGKLHLKNWL
jgi:cell division protein FtsB